MRVAAHATCQLNGALIRVALLQRSTRTAPEARTGSNIRRCTYRRLIAVQRKPDVLYDVECLYPDRLVPIPLGDLETARPICNGCTAQHIFRPDED
ncbi:MAG TPA: hypothetical protein VFK38_00955 [Candidatus Limnocylindrales bacterium]|nr:hypothetical protein [Candidatus Limnocylindrales bacterium]